MNPIKALVLLFALPPLGSVVHAQSDPIFADSFDTGVGVVLPGPPLTPARQATYAYGPFASSAQAIVDGRSLDRVRVHFRPLATVGDVNELLAQHDAVIDFMRPGVGAVTLRVPVQLDEAAMDALVERIAAHPQVAYVRPLEVTGDPQRLPPGSAGQPENRILLQHLLPTRFPAAWNASRLLLAQCASNPVEVLVEDFWHPSPGAAMLDRIRELPRFSIVYPSGGREAYPPVQDQRYVHGYQVAHYIGSLFDADEPTAAMPFAECLRVVGYSTQGVDQVEMHWLLNEALLSFSADVKVILNRSLTSTFLEKRLCTPSTCPPQAFRHLPARVMSVAEQALSALDLLRAQSDRLLIVNNAGNDRDAAWAPVYSGLSLATTASAYAWARHLSGPGAPIRQRLEEFIDGRAYWRPRPAYPGFPTFVLDPVRRAYIDALFETYQVPLQMPPVAVLNVGAATNGGTPAQMFEAPFSNSAPDLLVPGEDLQPLTGVEPESGTSFSAPQVTGLAAYLWLISPALRAADATETSRAILENLQADGDGLVRLLDAYAAMLSTDESVLPTPESAPVRMTLLDVDEDDDFDASDVSRFLQTLLRTPMTDEPTYGRHDLNGDGYEGGPRRSRFDLDRVGSTRFGAADYQTLQVLIEGTSLALDERNVTDLEILCYYAYTSLYSGDSMQRSELLGLPCTGVSARIEVNLGLAHINASGDQFVGATSGRIIGTGVARRFDLPTATFLPPDGHATSFLFGPSPLTPPENQDLLSVLGGWANGGPGPIYWGPLEFRRFDARERMWSESFTVSPPSEGGGIAAWSVVVLNNRQMKLAVLDWDSPATPPGTPCEMTTRLRIAELQPPVTTPTWRTLVQRMGPCSTATSPAYQWALGVHWAKSGELYWLRRADERTVGISRVDLESGETTGIGTVTMTSGERSIQPVDVRMVSNELGELALLTVGTVAVPFGTGYRTRDFLSLSRWSPTEGWSTLIGDEEATTINLPSPVIQAQGLQMGFAGEVFLSYTETVYQAFRSRLRMFDPRPGAGERTVSCHNIDPTVVAREDAGGGWQVFYNCQDHAGGGRALILRRYAGPEIGWADARVLESTATSGSPSYHVVGLGIQPTDGRMLLSYAYRPGAGQADRYYYRLAR